MTLTSPTAKGPGQTLEPTTDPEVNLVIPTERVNDSAISETQVTEDAEEDSEVLLVVRAEKKSGFEETRTEDFKPDEELLLKEELQKEEDVNPASELNDNAARAQLVEGTTDDAAAILDGFGVSGSPDTHEDMPSFSEWAQKRLEEAEKKKSNFPNL